LTTPRAVRISNPTITSVVNPRTTHAIDSQSDPDEVAENRRQAIEVAASGKLTAHHDTRKGQHRMRFPTRPRSTEAKNNAKK
jgi:hypothetical protein